MKIYVFGNQDYEPDSQALTLAYELEGKIKNTEFIIVKPNEDVPFVNQDEVFILDTIRGIDKLTVITDDQINRLSLSPRDSVHDFDLGFQIKYLKKLGKLGKVTIIGLPMDGKVAVTEIKNVIMELNG